VNYEKNYDEDSIKKDNTNPNRRKPVVATVEMASDNFLPERPANVGGAILNDAK
jgi:hypothetical protein